MKLNLGANDRTVPGYLSVDICPPADVVTDLSQPWPWPDSSVDEILAYDVCEHLPSRAQFMYNCWRVLKPGAHVYITTPNAAKGGGFQQDCTHITPYTINTFKYFDPRTAEWMRFHRHYATWAGLPAWPRLKVIHLIETSYQDSPIAPGCATPDPVYKLDVRLEAVK